MLKDKAYEYYMAQKKNCAEAIFLAANDTYQLGAGADTVKAIGVYGGGIGVGSICGAVAGASAAIGLKYNTGDAHTSPEMAEKLKSFMHEFQQVMNSELCQNLRPVYKNEETRCFGVVEKAAEILEKYM